MFEIRRLFKRDIIRKGKFIYRTEQYSALRNGDEEWLVWMKDKSVVRVQFRLSNEGETIREHAIPSWECPVIIEDQIMQMQASNIDMTIIY